MRLWTLALPASMAITPAAQAQTAPAPAAAPTQAELLDRVRALEAIVERLEARLSASPSPSLAAAGPNPPPAIAGPPPSPTTAANPPGTVLAGTSGTPAADPGKRLRLQLGSHVIQAGGFLKTQVAFSNYSGGNLATASSGRELLLPGTIPVGGSRSQETHIDGRQSRFWIATSGDIEGVKVGTRLEVDLLGGDIDNRTTNGSPIRLRRAFLTVGNFLFGQEWTNFQDNRAFPETGNLIGPSAGTLLVRQAQVRYTRGGFSVALENPETTYSPFAQPTRVTTGDSVMPDITARYTVENSRGFLTLSGLFLQLRSDTPEVQGKAFGWGVSTSGRVRTVGQDDIRFQLTAGRGIGRYLLNFANDGVLDARGDLHAVPLVGGFVAYRHFWARRIRSSFTFDAQRIFNEDYASPNSNRLAIGGQANLVWSPVASVDLGIEHIWLRRELEGGDSGTLNRSIFFAKFGF